MEVLRWGPADKGAARMLVILCHGVGADASQMAAFADAWSPRLPAAAFVAPDAPEPFDQAPLGRQWFGVQDRDPAALDAGARRAAPLLHRLIDAELDRLAPAAPRIPVPLALAGFSQGAMMALHAGLRRAPSPGAILAYSGALFDTPALARECTGRPAVLLAHGEQDPVVPFARGPEAAAALRRVGVPVETCWRPALGHAVDDAGLAAGLRALKRLAGA